MMLSNVIVDVTIPHRLSKRQSLSTTTVLLRTTFTRTIKLNLLLTVVIVVRDNVTRRHAPYWFTKRFNGGDEDGIKIV